MYDTEVILTWECGDETCRVHRVELKGPDAQAAAKVLGHTLLESGSAAPIETLGVYRDGTDETAAFLLVLALERAAMRAGEIGLN